MKPMFLQQVVKSTKFTSDKIERIIINKTFIKLIENKLEWAEARTC